MAFAEAANDGTDMLDDARHRLQSAVGPAGLEEAAATVAIFNGLVRVADGTGIQLDGGVHDESADFRARLGIDDFAGAQNTSRRPNPGRRSAGVADLFGN